MEVRFSRRLRTLVTQLAAAKNFVISEPPSHLTELGNADRREFLQVGE